MGQAFRRATGRIRSTSVDTTPSSSSQLKKTVDRTPSPVTVDKVSGDNVSPGSDGSPSVNAENVLEERDPQYDAMLSQMIGRIQSKPGGKLETGEAFVVEKYNRPMPKLRNTTPESDRFEERPVPPGTLNVSQIRHIILLHQGKTDDHDGPMDIPQIAERFRVDSVQIERILRSLSLPPEDSSEKKDEK
ncbi:unnamed protein product [Ilex paraguariensis]|uniref:Uncharacterized protein n=1 Tax=Ilex paraguariensis TaxID=185542 RepID=A0ABC8SPI2_9AQUA